MLQSVSLSSDPIRAISRADMPGRTASEIKVGRAEMLHLPFYATLALAPFAVPCMRGGYHHVGVGKAGELRCNLKVGSGFLLAFRLYSTIDYSRFRPTQVRYGRRPTFDNTRFFAGQNKTESEHMPCEFAAARHFLGASWNETSAASAA